MEHQRLPEQRRRNRNFDETHRLLIEKAVELISALGAEALSISALARESGINRSTVYYHFESREVLIEAVKLWSAEQMTDGFRTQGTNEDKIAESVRFVLSNPEVMKLWIDEFVSGGDIRDRYPQWNEFVSNVGIMIDSVDRSFGVNSEALSVMLLSSALIGARVFHSSVRPDLAIADAVDLVARTQTWLLRRCGMV